MMEYGDNRIKRITRFLYKWLWCSWLHKRRRCYPEVWDRGLDGPWHCSKCHPCGEGIDIFTGKIKFKWL